MNGSLELSGHQLRQIQAAAKTLLPSRRSDFKRRVGHNPNRAGCDHAELALPAFLCSK
jgi:hypothetical protein